MRVLQVTAIPVTALRFASPLANALVGAGHEVEFATGPGWGLDRLESQGFGLHRLPLSRNAFAWGNLHAIGALRAAIGRRGFDVVHAHTPAAAAVVRLAARGLGVRVIYTMHGSLWGGGVAGWRRALFTRMERRLGRWTDLVFTVNPEDAADCIRIARIPAERVRTLPAGGAGVGADFFLDSKETDALRRRTRERLGITPDAALVTYVGRTAAAKGMEELAHAFRSIAESENRAHLLIVGGDLPGERDPYTEGRFRRALGSVGSDRLHWQSFQEQVAPFFAASDVVVLPSRREGFGMTLAEAAALARPVVATQTRGARSVVDEGVTGLLVPVGDAEALSSAVLRLLRDGNLAARMGDAARARAEERFGREAVLAAYLEGYAALGLTSKAPA